MAVFFDRDGVINEPPSSEDRYLRRWEDFRFKAGMIEVLAEVKERGLLTVLITNQQGVGKGLMSMGDLETIHRAMQKTLARSGAAFDAIYAATGLKNEDSRRKPSPAMLLEAARELGIDYKSYAGIRAATGRDIVALLFSTNARFLEPSSQATHLLLLPVTVASGTTVCW